LPVPPTVRLPTLMTGRSKRTTPRPRSKRRLMRAMTARYAAASGQPRGAGTGGRRRSGAGVIGRGVVARAGGADAQEDGAGVHAAGVGELSPQGAELGAVEAPGVQHVDAGDHDDEEQEGCGQNPDVDE